MVKGLIIRGVFCRASGLSSALIANAGLDFFSLMYHNMNSNCDELSMSSDTHY